MASITREQFVSSFQGRSIDVANLTPELRKDLAAAGITAAELKPDRRRRRRHPGRRRARQAVQGDRQAGPRRLLPDARDQRRQREDHPGRGTDRRPASGGGEEPPADAGQPGQVPCPGTSPRHQSPRRQAGGKGGPYRRRPGWMWPRKEVGQKENDEKGEHNTRIVEYHATTAGKFNDDETAWCSSFMNWVMKQAGYKGTDSALAVSWKNYGTKSDGPVVGSIAVIDRGNGHGHVGFVVGRSGNNIVLLGGNQGDAVQLPKLSGQVDQRISFAARVPAALGPAAGVRPLRTRSP